MTSKAVRTTYDNVGVSEPEVVDGMGGHKRLEESAELGGRVVGLYLLEFERLGLQTFTAKSKQPLRSPGTVLVFIWRPILTRRREGGRHVS